MVWSLLGYEDTPAPGSLAAQRAAAENVPVSTKHRGYMNGDTDANHTVLEAMECDYERDCTPLYKAIEREDWSGVAQFLESGYWPGSFFADATPPANQARTWVTRFDPNDSTKVRWSQLPLHLAIVVEAPHHIVGALMEMYPQGVRCTDDQQMLPLHLAMRHSKDDRVVDLLLVAFPEAVNAKGKNDRTPVDCAMRGPNKVRGRILETFVEKSKAKAAKAANNNYVQEIEELKARLDMKEGELSDVKTKLMTLDTAKAQVETDLMGQIDELKKNKELVAMESAEKIKELAVERVKKEEEIQKRINDLEAEKKNLEKAHLQAVNQEKVLMKDLEKAERSVVEGASASELRELKAEIAKMKKARLEQTKSETDFELATIQKQINKEMGGTADTEELKSLNKTINTLRTTSMKATSNAEMSSLKAELNTLREELKDRESSSRTKVDLAFLKDSLEKELQSPEDKTPEQIATIQKALDKTTLSELDNKSNAELVALKKELQTLKTTMKSKAMENKVRQEIADLKILVAKRITETEGKDKSDLRDIQKKVEKIGNQKLEGKKNDELVSLKKQVGVLKDNVLKKESASKTRTEIYALKTKLQGEMKSPGRTRDEINAIKTTVTPMSSSKLESMSAQKLEALRDKATVLLNKLKLKEDAKEYRSELESLTTKVNAAKVNSQEMKDIRTIVHGMSAGPFDSREEFDVVSKKLAEVKKNFEELSAASKVHASIGSLKTTLENLKGMNENDKAKIQSIMEKLDKDQLASKNSTELAAVKAEVEPLVAELKEKDSAVRDLESIKTALEEKMKRPENKDSEELGIMMKAVDSIDVASMETSNKEEWNALKCEIVNLKTELVAPKVPSTGELAKECDALLVRARDGLKSAKHLSKADIAKTKRRITSIDAKFASKSLSQLTATKKELESINADLKPAANAGSAKKGGLFGSMFRRSAKPAASSGKPAVSSSASKSAVSSSVSKSAVSSSASKPAAAAPTAVPPKIEDPKDEPKVETKEETKEEPFYEVVDEPKAEEKKPEVEEKSLKSAKTAKSAKSIKSAQGDATIPDEGEKPTEPATEPNPEDADPAPEPAAEPAAESAADPAAVPVAEALDEKPVIPDTPSPPSDAKSVRSAKSMRSTKTSKTAKTAPPKFNTKAKANSKKKIADPVKDEKEEPNEEPKEEPTATEEPKSTEAPPVAESSEEKKEDDVVPGRKKSAKMNDEVSVASRRSLRSAFSRKSARSTKAKKKVEINKADVVRAAEKEEAKVEEPTVEDKLANPQPLVRTNSKTVETVDGEIETVIDE